MCSIAATNFDSTEGVASTIEAEEGDFGCWRLVLLAACLVKELNYFLNLRTD